MTEKTELPLIGISPDIGLSPAGPSSPGEPVVSLSVRTQRAILEAGGIPVILPIISMRRTIRKALEKLDGILVTGGNFDIDPRRYGESPVEKLGEIKEDRTQFELEVISLALERDLPLLGVCGGEQAINVALGGTLYQDIPTQFPNAMAHEQKAPKDHTGHEIRILPGSRLARIVACESLGVNTTHHQAVKRLGRELIVNAVATDGVTEGIESNGHSFVLGVQWHPEFLVDREVAQRRIFASFTAAAGEKGAKTKSTRRSSVIL